jgi:hypothetical protein
MFARLIDIDGMVVALQDCLSGVCLRQIRGRIELGNVYTATLKINDVKSFAAPNEESILYFRPIRKVSRKEVTFLFQRAAEYARQKGRPDLPPRDGTWYQVIED